MVVTSPSPRSASCAWDKVRRPHASFGEGPLYRRFTERCQVGAELCLSTLRAWFFFDLGSDFALQPLAQGRVRAQGAVHQQAEALLPVAQYLALVAVTAVQQRQDKGVH